METGNGSFGNRSLECDELVPDEREVHLGLEWLAEASHTPLLIARIDQHRLPVGTEKGDVADEVHAELLLIEDLLPISIDRIGEDLQFMEGRAAESLELHVHEVLPLLELLGGLSEEGVSEPTVHEGERDGVLLFMPTLQACALCVGSADHLVLCAGQVHGKSGSGAVLGPLDHLLAFRVVHEGQVLRHLPALALDEGWEGLRGTEAELNNDERDAVDNDHGSLLFGCGVFEDTFAHMHKDDV